MSRRFGILALVGALLLVTGEAWAQAPAGMEETVRPATTSIYGDTGLWFVPTGEVLRDGTWSASAYRLNWDVRQGFTDISHFEGTFAYGVKGGPRSSAPFGSSRESIATRVPSSGLAATASAASITTIRSCEKGWIGNDFGDTFLGAKINLLSESRQPPVALALRGMVKVPTGSDSGSGTGKMDAQFDFILSKEIASTVEVSGSIGYRHRGDPDEYDLSSGMPFGIGAQFPTRSPLKFTTEWYGEIFNNDVVTRTVSPAPASLIGDRWQRSAGHVEPSASVDADVRRDVAGEQRASSPAPASTGRPRPKIATISASTATTTSVRSSAGSSASAITPVWPAGRFRCRRRHRHRRRRRRRSTR